MITLKFIGVNMKRYSVLKKIARKLVTTHNMELWEAAEVILKTIEKDMKPKPYRYEDGDLGSCFKEGWEPDEEK